MTDDGTRAALLRRALGLTQAQMAQLLGLAEKSLARLEGEASWTTVEGRLTPVARLVRLLEMVAVGEAGSSLPALAVDGGESEVVQRALHSIAGRLERAPELQRLSLGELAGAGGRPSEWIYWATGARASAAETTRLADVEGVICRPLVGSGGHPPPYLRQLRPGDDVLICHNAEPVAWYRLRRVPKDARLAKNHPPLPDVLRTIDARSSLGGALTQAHYRLHDGALPDGSGAGWFTCLAVRRLNRPPEPPAPRPSGIRDAMTAFRLAEADPGERALSRRRPPPPPPSLSPSPGGAAHKKGARR